MIQTLTKIIFYKLLAKVLKKMNDPAASNGGKQENIFVNNPAFNGPIQVERVEVGINLSPEYRCQPLRHVWMRHVIVDSDGLENGAALNRADHIDSEPPTEQVCQCGQKYWKRHPDFPRRHGYSEYVLN